MQDGIRLSQCPMRVRVISQSLIILAITIGWFWVLSSDLQFIRADQIEVKITVETKKKEGKEN